MYYACEDEGDPYIDPCEEIELHLQQYPRSRIRQCPEVDFERKEESGCCPYHKEEEAAIAEMDWEIMDDDDDGEHDYF